MRQYLNRLLSAFGSTNKARSTRRAPRRAIPQLESLERREVLSVASPLPHAVGDGFASNPAFVRVFYINKSDHGLYTAVGDIEGDLIPVLTNPSGQGPQSVQSLSAGHGANSDDDVVAEAGDGSLWEYDIGVYRWQELLGPAPQEVQPHAVVAAGGAAQQERSQVLSYAAVDGGRVFAIFSDSTLHLYNGSGWSLVPTPGTVKALDAVTDKLGHDTVYVLNSDNSFGEVTYLPPQVLASTQSMAVARTPSVIAAGGGEASPLVPHYTQLAAAGHIVINGKSTTVPVVTQFSAGTDGHGYADVFATWWTGTLERNVGNSAASWTQFAAAGTFQNYSAIDGGYVWIDAADSLTLYIAPGVPFDIPLFGRLQSVSFPGSSTMFSGVANGGNFDAGVFYVDTTGQLEYVVYNTGFQSFNGGGASARIFPYLG